MLVDLVPGEKQVLCRICFLVFFVGRGINPRSNFVFYSKFSLLVLSLASCPQRLTLSVLPSASCLQRFALGVLPSASPLSVLSLAPCPRHLLGVPKRSQRRHVPISVKVPPEKTTLGGFTYQSVYPGTSLPKQPLEASGTNQRTLVHLCQNKPSDVSHTNRRTLVHPCHKMAHGGVTYQSAVLHLFVRAQDKILLVYIIIIFAVKHKKNNSILEVPRSMLAHGRSPLSD